MHSKLSAPKPISHFLIWPDERKVKIFRMYQLAVPIIYMLTENCKTTFFLNKIVAQVLLVLLKKCRM